MNIYERAAEKICGALDKASQLEAVGDLLHPERAAQVGLLYQRDKLQALRIEQKIRGALLSGVPRQFDTVLKAIKAEAPRVSSENVELPLDGLVLPKGYTAARQGIVRGDELVMTRPLAITALAADVSTGIQSVELAWQGVHGAWTRHRVPREVIATRRGIVALAALGAPIDDANSADVIRYLRSFEAENAGALKLTRSTTHLGWHGEEWVPGPAILVEAEGEGARLLRALTSSGSWAGWCSGMDRLLHLPHVHVAVLAAIASPLLSKVGQHGFVVDLSCESGGGKSSAMTVAASVAGRPTKDADGMVTGWNHSSDVGPASLAAFSHHMPLFMDDTKDARSEELVGQMLYLFAAGMDRTRGKKGGGTRDRDTWQLVTITTGERPIAQFSGSAGARARALCITGKPFTSGELADWAAKEHFLEHYGHALPRCIEASRHVALRDRFAFYLRDWRAELRSRTPSPLVGRMAAYGAMLDLAAEVLAAAGYDALLEHAAWRELVVSQLVRFSAEADRAATALAYVLTLTEALSDQVKDSRRARQPPGGWLGYRLDDKLYLRPDVVHGWLDRENHDRGVIQTWADRGWLHTQGGRRGPRVRVQRRGVPPGTYYCVLPSAWVALADEDE